MSSKSSTTVAPPSPEEKAWIQTQMALAQKQMEILDKSFAANQDYMAQTKPLLEETIALQRQNIAAQNDPVAKEIASRTSELQLQQLRDQADLAPLQKQLAQKQLEDAQRGFAATPEQVALIDQATAGARESGASDINQFQQDSFLKLRDNLAPSLGLRPGDTPIMDRGNLVQQEATRQYGKLTSDLATANASAKLNYPLQAAAVGNASKEFQQGLNASAQQFQAQLQEAANINRARLVGQAGNDYQGAMSGGMNLANASRPTPLSFQRGSTTTKSDPMGAAAGILGGLGGLAMGLGTGGLGFAPFAAASDERLKNDIETEGYDANGRRWVRFKYKADPKREDYLGVIAQEVEKTDPEAVLTNGLGLKFVDYGKLGRPMMKLRKKAA